MIVPNRTSRASLNGEKLAEMLPLRSSIHMKVYMYTRASGQLPCGVVEIDY